MLSQTNKQTRENQGEDDAGNPGPVYGQKDQAPNPRGQTAQKEEKTDRRQKSRNSEQGGGS